MLEFILSNHAIFNGFEIHFLDEKRSKILALKEKEFRMFSNTYFKVHTLRIALMAILSFNHFILPESGCILATTKSSL